MRHCCATERYARPACESFVNQLEQARADVVRYPSARPLVPRPADGLPRGRRPGGSLTVAHPSRGSAGRGMRRWSSAWNLAVIR